MQTSLNHLRYPSRSIVARAWIVLLVALVFSLGAAVAGAQPSIILTQSTRLFTTPAGGWGGGAAPVGGSFAMDAKGNILWGSTWGTNIYSIDPQSGNYTTLVTGDNNVAPLALDSNNNLYFGDTYSWQIVKLPYNSATGTYAALPAGGVSAVTAQCKGQTTDTAPCNFAINLGILTTYYGTSAMGFDPSGNFWVVIDQWPGGSKSTGNGVAGFNNSIIMCDQTCQYAAQYTGAEGNTPDWVYMYQDSTATDALGSIAFDPWGNLFFVQASINEAGPGDGGSVTTSGLYELPLSSGTYAASPTQLVSFTNTQTYNDGIFGVATDNNGTVYYTTPGEGIFAIPNTSAGGPDTKDAYAISPVGGKGIVVGPKGNIYQVAYTTGDGITRIDVGSSGLGGSGIGKSVNTASNETINNIVTTVSSVSVADNAGNCATTPALTVTATPSAEFSSAATTAITGAAAAAGCEDAFTGGSFIPETVTFDPANVGERTALFNISDTVNNVSGTGNVSGIGQGALVTLDPGVWTSYASGFTQPESVSVDAKGDLAIADAGANKVFWIAAGTTTPVAIGTGFSSPDATAFDTVGNLYIADSGNNQIVELPLNMSGTVDGTNQTVFVADTVTFGGKVLNGPSGLAFGPAGALYISDLLNGRVVVYNPSNGLTFVKASGLSFPWGLAVDSASGLYVAETGGGDVKVYEDGGTVVTLKPEGVTAPWGVAVDASGSVVISDKASGNIVRVPDLNGTLNDADALTIETNPKSAYGLALDDNGNLYSTDASGAAVYAVNRESGTLAFPTTDDTESSTLSIWLESAGNSSLGLSAPTISGAYFKLATASTDACGVSVAVGAACAQGVKFAPAAGIAAGTMETGTVTLNTTNARNAASPPVSLSGTTAAAPQSQTVTFHNPFPNGRTTYGVGLTTLTATASSGLVPVTFSVTSGPATVVNGDMLKITGAGAVTVMASQAGNTVYGPASQSIGITVDKAALTFSANSESTPYGTPFKPFSYKIAGFVNGDTKKLLKGEPKLSTTLSDTAAPGIYDGALVIRNGTLVALANYRFRFIDGNLTIEYLGTTKEPVLSPTPDKTYTGPVTVTITDATKDAAIYFTTDGKAPTVSKADKYTGAVKVSSTTTFKVIAKAPGYKVCSLTVTGTYNIKK